MGMGEIADLNTVRGCMDFERYGVHHYCVKQELGELLALTPRIADFLVHGVDHYSVKNRNWGNC